MKWNCQKCNREVMGGERMEFCRTCQPIMKLENNLKKWKRYLKEIEIDNRVIEELVEKWRIEEIKISPEKTCWRGTSYHDGFVEVNFLSFFQREYGDSVKTFEIGKFDRERHDAEQVAFLNKLFKWAKEKNIKKIEVEWNIEKSRIKELIFEKWSPRELNEDNEKRCKICRYIVYGSSTTGWSCSNDYCDFSKFPTRCSRNYCLRPWNNHVSDCPSRCKICGDGVYVGIGGVNDFEHCINKNCERYRQREARWKESSILYACKKCRNLLSDDGEGCVNRECSKWFLRDRSSRSESPEGFDRTGTYLSSERIHSGESRTRNDFDNAETAEVEQPSLDAILLQMEDLYGRDRSSLSNKQRIEQLEDSFKTILKEVRKLNDLSFQSQQQQDPK
jgi:hypothetical protein